MIGYLIVSGIYVCVVILYAAAWYYGGGGRWT